MYKIVAKITFSSFLYHTLAVSQQRSNIMKMNSCNSTRLISDKRKCKYHDRGFCYKRNNCEFQHPVDVCEESICSKGSDCYKRHPRTCVFYYTDKKCKFNDKCFFKHIKEDFEDKNTELNLKVVSLNSNIKNLEGKVEMLEKDLNKKNIEVNEHSKEKKSKEKKIKDLNTKFDNTEVELKDMKKKVADLQKQNVSILKENTNLEEKLKKSIENIKIKDTQITNFEKETDSLKVTLTSIEEDIKLKDIKILQCEKESKSINVSLISKEEEIKTFKCNNESLKGNLKTNSEIISKFKIEVAEYQKKSEDRRKEMYFVNKSLQETLFKKEEEITELENKLKFTETSESNFVCNDCSDVLKTEILLRKHIETIHKGTKDGFVCEHCEYEAKAKYDLNIHVKMEHGIKPKMSSCQKGDPVDPE